MTLARVVRLMSSMSPLCALHSLSHLLLHPPDLPLHLLCGSVRREFPCAVPNEESDSLVSNAPLTGYEPKFFDDYHFSETTEIFIQESSTPGPRTCMTRRSVTTPSAERSLHHCSFRSEENQRTEDKLITPLEESLLSSQSLCVGHVRTVRPVDEFGSLISNVRENPCRDSENEQIRVLLERQKEQILADCGAEIQKHEFQADYDRRSIQKLNGVSESQRGVRLIVLWQETHNFDEINNIFTKIIRTKSGSS